MAASNRAKVARPKKPARARVHHSRKIARPKRASRSGGRHVSIRLTP